MQLVMHLDNNNRLSILCFWQLILRCLMGLHIYRYIASFLVVKLAIRISVRVRGWLCGYDRPQGTIKPCLEVIKLEFILRLKIKWNDWLLADTCPQAANHCALFWSMIEPWHNKLNKMRVHRVKIQISLDTHKSDQSLLCVQRAIKARIFL